MLNYIQYGGNVNINSSNDGIVAPKQVNIKAGTLTIKAGGSATRTGGYADGSLYTGRMNIEGGTVSADSDFYAGYNDSDGLKGTIKLGLSDTHDYIKAGGYKAGTVRVSYGQTLSDDTRTYSGTLTSTDVKAMAGKTLKQATLYKYIDENGEEKQVTATPLNSGNTTQELKDGWYIVNEDVTMTPAAGNHREAFIIARNANVRIILADGAAMAISQNNTSGNFISLNICAQSQDKRQHRVLVCVRQS